MTKLETQVRALFDAYAKRSDDALQNPPKEDIDGVVSAFAPFFVESSPRGVIGGANDDRFRSMIPQGFARYRQVGGKHMTVKGLKVIELDHCHAVADVDWDFAYTNKAGQSGHVTFTNFYFVTIAGGTPKVFGYVTPDEEQAMKDHGLV
ncbi:hypothetical protein [Devosia sp. Root635]|uniref:hypothetical protein n=1 Tax=Devosia sp. Root635 TaxID=1736575 RepID=UPI0006F91487|nr:hypothetical protein [Devosia sp. Root635]KRA55370.1 hypothetical protein ASD80_13250 [Devosia sp. Root635]